MFQPSYISATTILRPRTDTTSKGFGKICSVLTEAILCSHNQYVFPPQIPQEHSLTSSQTSTTTPSQFATKWLFQFHYVIDRIPSPSARGLYIMPFVTFSHILDLVLEFDSEALDLGLSPSDFKPESPETFNNPKKKRYLNPFTPAALLRDAVLEVLQFCEATLGYFPDHTFTGPLRSRSRILREGQQLGELIGKVEEARRERFWYGRQRRRSWRRRAGFWLRRVCGKGVLCCRSSHGARVWCL